MLIINCPVCGPRSAQEFRYGGEVNPRPSAPMALDDRAWADYVYLKNNPAGVQQEWWYHRSGCGTWFLAERDTRTNDITRTWLWQPKETLDG